MPRTVAGNLDNLNIVYGHWWCGVCKILDENPFSSVEPPREEKRPPRVIEPPELDEFLKWLVAKYGKWRCPSFSWRSRASRGAGSVNSQRIDDKSEGQSPLLRGGHDQRAQAAVGTAAARALRGTEKAGWPPFRLRAILRTAPVVPPEEGQDPHAQMVRSFTRTGW